MLARRGLLLAVLLSIPLAASRAADDPNEVVGRVGSTEVKVGEMREFIRALAPNLRQQAEKDPQVLNRLVRAKLEQLAVLNEARDKKWEQRPEVMRQIDAARNQVLFTSYIESVARPPDSFPSEAEIATAYEANKANLMKPAQYHLAQIFLAIAPGADKAGIDAAQKRADELDRKAHAKGADFGALARQSSEHKDSAQQGGDIGWLPAQQLLPEIRNAVATMAKGEISPVIRTQTGFHVIKLLESQPSALATQAEARETLVAGLRQRKFEENQAAFLSALLERSGIAVNEMVLKKLLEPAQ